MKTKNKNQNTDLPPNNNKTSTTVGAIIIIAGVFLLLRNLQLGFLIPNWLFGWQMILIIIGLVIGVNSKFEKKSSIILIVIGSVFLLRDWLNFAPGKILIPALAIVLGIYLINRNRKTPQMPFPTDDNDPTSPPTPPKDEFDWDKRVVDFDSSENENNTFVHEEKSRGQNSYSDYYSENYLKIDSIFGSAKKIILSKNFLGGTMTNIFGSTEVNLLQADLNQPVVVDIFQLFGSTKIIVPPHWGVSTTVSSIFSENDDRRKIINSNFEENRKMYITGTSIFGSVTIKNS